MLMKKKIIKVNDKMQKGYKYELTESYFLNELLKLL